MTKYRVATRIIQFLLALAFALYLMHLPTMPTSQPEVSIVKVEIR